ncbi:MAG: EAL domain-containing protein [Pseudomonadota bacterium]
MNEAAKPVSRRVRFHESLRARLLLVVAVAIGPMLAWAVGEAALTQREEAARARAETLQAARLFVARHESNIQETRAVLRALSHTDEVASGDPESCNLLFREVLKDHQMLINLVAVSPSGHVFCSAKPLPPYPVYLGDRLYVETAFKTKKFTVSDYLVSRVTGDVTIIFAHPYVGQKDDVSWLVMGGLDLTWFKDQVATANLPQRATVTLTDIHGSVLVDLPSRDISDEMAGRSILGTPMEQALHPQKEWVFEAAALNGDMHIFASIPLMVEGKPTSYVVIGIPFSTAFAPSRQKIIANLTAIAVLGLIAAVFAVWLSNSLVARRTDQILAAVERLETGDLSARSGMPPARDEIGHLASAFDDMAAALERADAERQREEERWRDLAEAARDGILVHDGVLILDANRRLADIFGYERSELIGAALTILVADKHAALLQDYAANRREDTAHFTGHRRDGSTGPIEVSGGNAYYRGEARHVLSIRDIGDEIALKQRVQWLSQVMEQSPSSVMLTDTEGAIEYVNPRFSETSLYSPTEAIGRGANILNSGLNPSDLYADLWNTLKSGEVWRGEILNRRKDGSLFWEYEVISPVRDGAGRVTHYAAVKEDVTLRKEYEERLLRQAHYDELTGLPNRLLARDRLNVALARAQRDGQKVAVMMLDLDGFKKINDTLGHTVGAALLGEISTRLKSVLREADTVARFGGDEFLIILPDLKQDMAADVTGRKILHACSRAATIGPHELFVTASLGITLFPDDGDSPDALLKNADTAMYEAKRAGKNRAAPFRKEAGQRIVRHLAIETGLRRALERHELSLVFQPIIDLQTGLTAGVEALVRWHNAELGTVSPAEFIPVAEESDIIHDIGDWIMQEGCRVAGEIRKSIERPLFMTINLSARQVDRRIPELVAAALDTHALPPELLKIEVTESLLVRDMPLTLEMMESLRTMGVGLALDDFGTGYSSLSYVKSYPFSILKIDQSFIRDVMKDVRDRRLFAAIVAMARALGLDVTAEGVETAEHLALVRDQGCTYAQGYYFSVPLPQDRFMAFVRKPAFVR